MKIAALFHVSFEKLGLIEDWILTKGYSLTEYHLYNDPRLPLIHEFDMLIIMGGPMSVNEDDRYRWLASEKELIRHCRESGKPVLGICLGAQLIASALGNRVFPGKHTEIGWFPVEFNQSEESRTPFSGFTGESHRIPLAWRYIRSARGSGFAKFIINHTGSGIYSRW